MFQMIGSFKQQMIKVIWNYNKFKLGINNMRNICDVINRNGKVFSNFPIPSTR